MTEKCKVPECGNTLTKWSKTGLCKDHIHRRPYCTCLQCSTGKRPKYRVKTREEMVAECLLPVPSTAPRPPVFFARLRQLHAQGKTISEAASLLGLSWKGLAYYEKRLGIKFKRRLRAKPKPAKPVADQRAGPVTPLQLMMQMAAVENARMRDRGRR